MQIQGMKQAAYEFSERAHVGQVRKYSGEPYISHPKMVAAICTEYGLSDQAIAAAYLHDVVEDCGVLDDELVALFGDEVATKVRFLTAIKPAGMSRVDRKALYRAKMAHAPSDVQSIKLADMLHNGPSIVANDPKLAKIWIPEVEDMLGVLKDGHPALRAKVQSMVDLYYVMRGEAQQV